MELPGPAQQSVAKGMAAYIRATPRTELPASLKALEKLVGTQRGEKTHARRLAASLEDEALRKRVLEWLEEGKPPLTKAEVGILRLVCERPEGWQDRLSADRPEPRRGPAGGDERIAEAEKRAARERDAARRAKEEAKRVRELARAEADDARRDRAQVESELGDARKRIRELERDLREAQRKVAQADKALAREARKAEQARERQVAREADLQRRLKDLKSENRDLKARLEAAERESDRLRSTRRTVAEPAARRERRPLAVPKGRFAEDPDTLREWLRADGVAIVIDGYNVTRHEEGYGHLDLQAQRETLIAKLRSFVQSHKVDATIVWDSMEKSPGSRVKRYGRLKVVFTHPDEGREPKDIADDEIVRMLSQESALAERPVVVVTSDATLQGRVAELGATNARSPQLLALLR